MKDGDSDSDKRLLEELNIAIGEAEIVGDAAAVDELLCPIFAMRRANGTLVDRERFLQDLNTNMGMRETRVISVDLIGVDRALVICVVATSTGGGVASFHNARLWIRDGTAGWKMLSWANESLT